MTVYKRRDEIIERMKVRKSDTAYNLSVEFQVSKCTIYRDIQELSVSGYPLICEMGHGGGIKWTGGKRNILFTERELLALHNAIPSASAEDKFVLENLISERIQTIAESSQNDLYGILVGVTQRVLAMNLGITESHLSRVLSGQKKPSAELAKRILEYKERREAKNEN